LIRAAIDHAVRVEPIPGASAVLTALIASGLPTDEFTFLGFPPARSKDKIQWFHSLAAEPRTLVFFESPHRIRDTLGVLRETIGDRQICVGRELTKAHEEFVRGPISEVVDLLDHPRGEYTIVIDRSNDKIYPVAEPPADEVIRNEFCHMTDNGGVGRRAALSRVASRYGLSTRAVYAAIERAKRSADIKL
jgi:16S rRNA (cytidine1402-2'-O)-methyltransferase